MIDAQAEIDALPDSMVGVSEMQEYGYTWNEMLPLTQERALELFDDDLPVYLLHTDGSETTVSDRKQITEDILNFIREGADLVICSGGMSVDPDDRTPGAIKDTGAEIVTYGAPVLPGAMLLLAYYKTEDRTVPILGLPGCVMYAKRTVFDLILPRVMADDRICAKEISAYGEGGLCLNCQTCTFPNCGFGK